MRQRISELITAFSLAKKAFLAGKNICLKIGKIRRLINLKWLIESYICSGDLSGFWSVI
jgi:hypothetical protein